VSVALVLEQSNVIVSIAPSPDDLKFTYFDEPSLISIVPSRGSINGGDLVSISGSNIDARKFANGLQTLCKFGDTTVTAKFSLNGASILCKSPPLPFARTSTVPVSISLNGVDFSRSVIQYSYEVPMDRKKKPDKKSNGNTTPQRSTILDYLHYITIVDVHPRKGPSFGGTACLQQGFVVHQLRSF
jgi:hypothetical protein